VDIVALQKKRETGERKESIIQEPVGREDFEKPQKKKN